MDPVKVFDRIHLSSSNLVLPKERLINTPSRKDGMSRDLEIDMRITGCHYIQSAGILLKLPQVAMATAQILFHRFYYAKSFVKFKCYYTMMACLFLAAKLEESSRRLRDVINVFHHIRNKRFGSSPVIMDYVGEEYFRLRNLIIKHERYILKELGFCVHIQHPHKLIISCLQILELEKNTPLIQKAWNFMNDSLRTNIFLRYNVQTIACSCIYLASGHLKIALPLRPPWWELFDVNYIDMKTISLELSALYQREIKKLQELEKQVDQLQQLLISKKDSNKEMTPSSQTASPAHLGIVSQDSQEKSPKEVSQLTVSSDKVESEAPPTTNDLSSNDLKPLNGHKRPLSITPSSISPASHEKRSKLQNVETTSTSSKPIISPIKLSSDSEEDIQFSRYNEVHKNDKSIRIKSHHRHERSGRHKTERRRKREVRSRSQDRRSWSRERSSSRERWKDRRHHHHHRDDYYNKHHRK